MAEVLPVAARRLMWQPRECSSTRERLPGGMAAVFVQVWQHLKSGLFVYSGCSSMSDEYVVDVVP